MDFSVRGASHPGVNAQSPSGDGTPKHSSSSRAYGMSSKGFRLASVVLLFCITILLLAVIFLFHYGPADETKYVNANDFQAVDVNVGGSTSSDQIYFGHVKVLNSGFVVHTNNF
jgi:hypothetical protein